MTNLDALNIVLDAVGVYPVTSYDSPHPDAVRARQKLERYSTEIQSRGWWFNKEHELTLLPNLAEEIVVPATTLVIDSVDPREKYAKRGSKLYDPINHTYRIPHQVVVDMIIEITFDHIPVTVQNYITMSAAVEMAVTREGDQNKINMLNTGLLKAKSEAFADDIRNSNYNVFNTGLVARAISAARPAVRRI